MGDMVGRLGDYGGECIGLSPNIHNVLRQGRQSQRRWGDGRRAWGALRCSTAGFEDGGKGHNPGKQAASHSLERQRNELSVESRKNRVILTP